MTPELPPLSEARAAAMERERIAAVWEANHGFDKYGVAAFIRSVPPLPPLSDDEANKLLDAIDTDFIGSVKWRDAEPCVRIDGRLTLNQLRAIIAILERVK